MGRGETPRRKEREDVIGRLEVCEGMSSLGYINVKEAAAYLGYAERTVRDFIADGTLRAVIPRGRTRGYLISWEELKRFVAEELVPAPTGGGR